MIIEISPTFTDRFTCSIEAINSFTKQAAGTFSDIDLSNDFELSRAADAIAVAANSGAEAIKAQLVKIRDDRNVQVSRSRRAISEALLPFRPFPVEFLPMPVAAYIQACADSMDADASTIALPMLSVLGAAIGNSCVDRSAPPLERLVTSPAE
jgi:hypothetical protein